MKQRLFLLLLIASSTYAQSETGINFQRGLNWQQVIQKAQKENKHIFVDCYATWCGPCKMMDRYTYTSKEVAALFDEKFISIKVQMDTTPNDNDEIRQWYADASSIREKYKVTVFPTYLFFSPEGNVLHKDVGFKFQSDFISLANTAMKPDKQYYAMLSDYQKGKKEKTAMKQLALYSISEGNPTLGQKIAEDYLNSLPDDSLYTPDNLDFLIQFKESKKTQQILQVYKTEYLSKLPDSLLLNKSMLTFFSHFPYIIDSQSHFFNILRDNLSKVDSTMKYNYSDQFIKYIINREEIEEKLWKNNKPILEEPNWNMITKTIIEKYNSRYANELIPEAQLQFYKRVGNWRKYALLRDRKTKQFPPTKAAEIFSPNSTWLLNSDAWDVFLHCNDMQTIKKALTWVELAIRFEQPEPNIQYFDTRANILYKLGRVNEAITQEKRAIEIDIKNAKKEGRQKGPYTDDYTAILKKMEQGIPTWDASSSLSDANY